MLTPRADPRARNLTSAAQAGHPGQRDQARGPSAGQSDGRAVTQAPGIELIGVDLSADSNLSSLPADVAIVLGGDGTVLHAARRMEDHPTPVSGRQRGPARVPGRPDARRVSGAAGRPGRAAVYDRQPDDPGVRRHSAQSARPARSVVSNDAVVRAAPVFHLVDIGLSIDGESVMTYRGDGLIIATPVGSTAHSLSAGGPILPPNAHMFVVTPICPHTLTQRPLVDSGHKVYRDHTSGRGLSTMLVIDGQVQVPLRSGDRVTIRRGKTPFPWSGSPATASTEPFATSSAGAALPTAAARSTI